MCADASSRVGPNPRGPLRACSLAVRAQLTSYIDEAGAPPALIVGLSGGADSLALALTTIDVAARAGIPVVTVTVDHGLRAGSGDEAREVADLAESLGARALVETVAVDGRGGPEASARDARRAALRAVGLRENAPILLGHTMDDQAETVLLRLARGSGPSSLRAIAPISRDDDGVTWLRPLLGLRRADTEAACEQAALGMDPVPALARTAVLCAHDDDALAQWARELTGAARVADAQDLGEGVASVALAVSLMRGAPRAVRTRTLREAARAAGLRALSSGHIDDLDDLVVAWRGQGPIHLPGGLASRVGRGERAQIILRAHPAGEDGHQS